MKKAFFILMCMLSTSLVQSQSWIRQNPFPVLAEIMDIDFDGPHGLAVGQEGLCFTTNDYGTTWLPRKLYQENYTFDAALVVPGSAGQVMLAGGIILMISKDGGQTWEIAHNSPGNTYKIQYLSDGTILSLGREYNVYTIDQGENWAVIPNPENESSAGHFTDTLHGWVESGNFNNSQVWITEDAGDTWSLRDTLRHPVISGIHMLDLQTGFMAARDYVYKTTDGGHQWQQLHGNAVNSIQDMHVVNEQNVWTCLNNGFLFHTGNGGMTWTETDPAIISSNKTNGIYANLSGQVWATGKFVSILYSADSAEHWTDQIPSSKSIMYMPHFFDENHGTVGGSAGTVLYTDNGGASWRIIKLDPDDNYFAVQMLSDSEIIIGSSAGKILHSTDSGHQWNVLGEQLGQIVDLHAFSADQCIAVSEQGTIWRTVDGGNQWEAVYVSPFGLLQSVHFVDQLKGWACGWFGQILHTENGGATWTPQSSGTQAQFKGIHFTSEVDGWIIASSFTDSIWQTHDGGQSWSGAELPWSIFWQDISFSSPDTGWIAGGSAGSGIIIRTNDGGQQWTYDHQSPEALFGIYAVPHSETVWSTGVGGNIVKFSPCTFNPTIFDLTGENNPCQRDTVTYLISSSDVDIFEWTYPSDWVVYGNSNTSTIQFIIGQESGVVTVTGKDACGATTDMLSINVFTVAVPTATITENDATLTCNLDNGFYQWLRNGSPISGANEQSYTALSSGIYEVVVTMVATGCEARSNAITLEITSTDNTELPFADLIPNPASDFLLVKGDHGSDQVSGVFEIFDMGGAKMAGPANFTGQIEVINLPSGMYLVVIQVNGLRFFKKIIRV